MMQALQALPGCPVLSTNDVSTSTFKNQYTADGQLCSVALTNGQDDNRNARIEVFAGVIAAMRTVEQCWESRTASSGAIGFFAQGGAGFLDHLKQTCCAV